MRQVVLDARGSQRELRSMAAPLKAGERFKIRVTATFDAVAEVDQVLGDAWDLRRTGQVYPQPGLSVQMKAGETVVTDGQLRLVPGATVENRPLLPPGERGAAADPAAPKQNS